MHEARAYAATYLHLYSPRGARVASYSTQPQISVVGFLSTTSPAASFVAGVLQGLKEVGFIDGQNAAVHESGYGTKRTCSASGDNSVFDLTFDLIISEAGEAQSPVVRFE